MNHDVRIRTAAPEDAERLLAIYAPYVRGTAITFEYDVPTAEDFSGRIRQVLTRYPWLVAEADGEALGYAYISPFHQRAAYAWAAETSLYVRRDCRGQGVGGRLHQALEACAREQGIVNLEACIAYPETEDETLTRSSAEFHAHMGYRMVGRFFQCGQKFGRWYDMVWMEKHIGPHEIGQPAPLRFDQVRERVKERFGIE